MHLINPFKCTLLQTTLWRSNIKLRVSCLTSSYVIPLWFLSNSRQGYIVICLWLPTRITCHNLGDLCTESAELLLQSGSAVQCRHTGLLKPFQPFALTAEVGHGRVPVEHQERCWTPFMLQGTRVAPGNTRVGNQLLKNNHYHSFQNAWFSQLPTTSSTASLTQYWEKQDINLELAFPST